MSNLKRAGAVAPTLRKWVVFRQYQDEPRQHVDYIESLDELAALVETGPDSERIFHIRIELNQARKQQ
ncbi:MAG: hypothetical protein ACOZAM_18575 [Pseudomonadota bacterium]